MFVTVDYAIALELVRKDKFRQTASLLYTMVFVIHISSHSHLIQNVLFITQYIITLYLISFQTLCYWSQPIAHSSSANPLPKCKRKRRDCPYPNYSAICLTRFINWSWVGRYVHVRHCMYLGPTHVINLLCLNVRWQEEDCPFPPPSSCDWKCFVVICVITHFRRDSIARI